MSASEFTGFLARLYVDAPFRRLFHLAPDSVIADYDLDQAEIDALRGIDAQRLDYFAASLLHKRRKRVEQVYGPLFRLHRAGMERLFARFHQLFHARPRQTVAQDVIDFGQFIEQSLEGTPPWPDFCADLARYQRLYFEAAQTLPEPDGQAEKDLPPLSRRPQDRPRLRRGVHCASFDHDVVAVESALESEADMATQPGDACHLVFLPRPAMSGPAILRINGFTLDLLTRCDGQTPVVTIIEDTCRALAEAVQAPVVAAALDRLAAAGALTGQAAPRAVQAPLNWLHAEAL